MHLIFALIWLAVSLALFALPLLHPRGMAVTLGPTGVSAGWIALLLCLYNLVRWWSARAHAANRRALREDFHRRRPQASPDQAEPYRPPDPNFDFTEQPPEPAGDPDERFRA
jgi:hypothetical protein